jgi:hypothetical protein
VTAPVFGTCAALNYPRGAMRQCTHIAETEAQYLLLEAESLSQTSRNAQNSTIRDDLNSDDERAEDDPTTL